MSRRALCGLVAAALLAATGLPAQEAGGLENVAELARQGRTAEARTALAQWWEDDRAQASRRDLQRAIWLRGSLTVDPDEAALDYRRLIIEFPGGPFSDRALLRLAQEAHAVGDGEAARVYVRTLGRDYPTSPVTREAEAWLNAAGPAPRPPARPEEVTAEPEEEEQEAAASEEVVASEEGVAPPAAPDEAAADPVRFSVQIGAFAEEDRARSLYERAAAEGFDARIVRVGGTRLLHVRVGLFDSVDPATELLRRLGGMGYVAALVRDANTEERIRR